MQVDIINGQLTDHFRLSEFVDYFENRDCPSIYLSPDFFLFVKLLEDFRVWYNRPINITSGYRSKACNDFYKGSSNSAHLHSLAVDFRLPSEFFTFCDSRKSDFLNNVRSKWTSLCESFRVYPQVNFYDNRLHLGISRKCSSFLDYRSKEDV